MLHRKRVIKGVTRGFRRSVRLALGIKQRPKTVSPVLNAGFDYATDRYARICAFYQKHLDVAADIKGRDVCEVGCGDCLATADLFLNFGARHVHLIESTPIICDDAQRRVLAHCSKVAGFGGVPVVLTPQGTLDETKVTPIRKYLENIEESSTYDTMVSYDVLEHVEDIDSFYANCYRMLRPGGIMLHKIDLSGHEYFEDPLPPLDFQTYSDWLYNLIFPKFYRATRRLRDDHLDSLRRAGFRVEEVGYLREADAAYIEQVRPLLRPEIRDKTADQLKALDWYVKARKP